MLRPYKNISEMLAGSHPPAACKTCHNKELDPKTQPLDPIFGVNIISF